MILGLWGKIYICKVVFVLEFLKGVGDRCRINNWDKSCWNVVDFLS